MSKEKAIIHINNVSKMIGSKRIKLSEGMTIHIQNELVLALKELEEAVDATDETITLSNGLGYNGYEKTSIFMFISFKELKDMAIERLTMSLEQHQKMYEEL